MIYLERETFKDVWCPECGEGFAVVAQDGEFNDGAYAVDCLDCDAKLKVIVQVVTSFVCVYRPEN